MKEGFCKSQALAKYLSLSRSTIRHLVSDGMPHYRIGSTILFKYDEVDDWMLKFKTAADGSAVDRMVDELLAAVMPPDGKTRK